MSGWLTERRERMLRLAAFVVGGFVLATVADHPAIAWMREEGFEALDRFEREDWWQMFRQFGYIPTWIFLCGAIFLHATSIGDARLRRAACIAAWMPLAAAAVAGGLADALKPLLLRFRPEHAVAPAVYAFADFAEQFPSGRRMGLPSSHSAVAFGGAFGLARLFPRAWWVFVLAAAGTGFTRVIAGAHYPSDVFVGALVGYAAAAVGGAVFLRQPRDDRPAGAAAG